jgi:hypothetical protein
VRQYGWMSPILRAILALALLSASLLGQARRNQPLPILTVCEALTNLNFLNGTLVAVTGLFVSGPTGDPYLRQQNLRGASCANTFSNASEGVGIWRPVLLLNPNSEDNQPVPIEAGSAKLNDLIKQAQRSSPNTDFYVTLVGELRARNLPSIKRTPGGVPRGEGYGTFGTFPAGLMVNSIRQVEIQPYHPPRDSNSSCSDIESVDFGNRTFIAEEHFGDDRSTKELRFHNGKFDEGEIVDDRLQVDTEFIIEDDLTIRSQEGLPIRFVHVFQDHVLGTGSWTWLFGFTCSSGRIVKVVQENGEGMEVVKLSPTSIRLRFAVWRPNDAHCCPTGSRDAFFVWSKTKQKFVPKSR